MQYGGIANSFPCSILRRYYKMETVKYCNKLNELSNPLFVGLRYFTIDDEFLKLVHEGHCTSLKDYFSKNDDFFIKEGNEIFYASPLLQKLTRELMVQPKRSMTMGYNYSRFVNHLLVLQRCISINVSPLQCREGDESRWGLD
ncbi:uncharacterized protein LOC114266168 [Camellia sinensis]|uniref:uncharacterized protein LOC114266168 n=1 Tax=Camellia sinensis TaxID=4442 RepID=UPI001036B4A7|nr:uncharacterized protein LOC114266168 [Camellia sinensis]